MNAKKRLRSTARRRTLLGRLRRTVHDVTRRKALLTLAAVMIALVAVGSTIAWRQIGPVVTGHRQYYFDPRSIEITPQPNWVRADIRAEVIRDASLDTKISILDPNLAERLASAFAFHPWVAQVRKVTVKLGPNVLVDLAYRKPAVVVKVATDGEEENLLADSHGVRLPSDQFSASQWHQLPKLKGIVTQPLVGQRWNDPKVLGGAQLAARLSDLWLDLQLAAIIPSEEPSQADASGRITFVLLTRGGRKIHWEHAPTADPTREATAAENLLRLKQLLKGVPASDDQERPNVLDVRQVPRSSVPAPPQTASRPFKSHPNGTRQPK